MNKTMLDHCYPDEHESKHKLPISTVLADNLAQTMLQQISFGTPVGSRCKSRS